jgi:ATP-dependent DNA helicase RecQ
VLLAENRDKGLHVFFINQIDDAEAKNHRWRQYREVWGYVDGEACRRQAILRHFGDRTRPHAEGRCCDVCDGQLEVVGQVRAVRSTAGPRAAAALAGADPTEAILAVVAEASPSVGRTRVVEILRGGRSKVIVKYAYDELPGYGSLHAWRADELLGEVDALIDSGRLSSTGGRFPKLRVQRRAA